MMIHSVQNPPNGLNLPSQESAKVTKRNDFGMLTTRRCFLLARVFLLIGCLIGFIYQVTIFLLRYYTYPVVLTQNVEFPNELEVPALSVCNFNMYRRTVFCDMYRDKCKIVNDSVKICKAWPHYCKDDKLEPNFLMPQVTVQDLTSYPREVHRKLAHTSEGLIHKCKLFTAGKADIPCDVLGPFLQFQCITEWNVPNVCYTINSKYGKPNKKVNKVLTPSGIEVRLFLEHHEYFPDVWYPGIQLAVHTTDTIPNPFTEGIILESGRSYFISVTQEETILLPHPYSTNCLDFHQMWRMRGGKGPTNKKECFEECILNKSLELYGCVVCTVFRPHSEKICENVFELNREINMDCSKMCNMPCYERTYDLSVQYKPKYEVAPQCRDGNWSKEWCSSTKIVIHFSKFMNIQYITHPQYTDIEIFSSIGGYLGMWLGVSLLSVSQLTEPVVRYVLNSAKRRRQKRSKGKNVLFSRQRPLSRIMGYDKCCSRGPRTTVY